MAGTLRGPGSLSHQKETIDRRVEPGPQGHALKLNIRGQLNGVGVYPSCGRVRDRLAVCIEMVCSVFEMGAFNRGCFLDPGNVSLGGIR